MRKIKKSARRLRLFLRDFWGRRRRLIMGAGAVIMHASFLILGLAVASAPWTFGEWWGGKGDGARNTIFSLVGIGAFYGLWIKFKQLNLDKRTRESDGLNRASGQLGDEKFSVHHTAVRSLEHMAVESPKKTDAIIEIFNHFIKVKCHVETKDENWDILSRKNLLKGDERTNVELVIKGLTKITPKRRRHRTILYSVNFEEFDLVGANFELYTFMSVNFKKAHLALANFRCTFMTGVHLAGAHLHGAKFERAHIGPVKFGDADLSNAVFYETDCSATDFSDKKCSLTQDQVNGMVYFEGRPPKLRPNLNLPEDGAYRNELRKRKKTYQRRRIKSGKWIKDRFS